MILQWMKMTKIDTKNTRDISSYLYQLIFSTCFIVQTRILSGLPLYIVQQFDFIFVRWIISLCSDIFLSFSMSLALNFFLKHFRNVQTVLTIMIYE